MVKKKKIAKKKTTKRKTSKKKALRKKSVKKKGVKKKKAAPSKKKTKKAPEGRMFVLCNGKHLHSIADLAKELKTMGNDIFAHHVTPHKNDFATWIYHVFNEKALAEKIAHIKDKTSMEKLLKGHR